MTALVDLVPIDELVIIAFGPASWHTVDLAGEEVWDGEPDRPRIIQVLTSVTGNVRYFP